MGTVNGVFARIGRDFVEPVGKSSKLGKPTMYFKTDRWNRDEALSRYSGPKRSDRAAKKQIPFIQETKVGDICESQEIIG